MSQSSSQRREAAEKRQAEYDQLSLEEKLKRALARGDNKETKEVVRLRAQIESQKA